MAEELHNEEFYNFRPSPSVIKAVRYLKPKCFVYITLDLILKPAFCPTQCFYVFRMSLKIITNYTFIQHLHTGLSNESTDSCTCPNIY